MKSVRIPLRLDGHPVELVIHLTKRGRRCHGSLAAASNRTLTSEINHRVREVRLAAKAGGLVDFEDAIERLDGVRADWSKWALASLILMRVDDDQLVDEWHPDETAREFAKKIAITRATLPGSALEIFDELVSRALAGDGSGARKAARELRSRRRRRDIAISP